MLLNIEYEVGDFTSKSFFVASFKKQKLKKNKNQKLLTLAFNLIGHKSVEIPEVKSYFWHYFLWSYGHSSGE